MLVSAAEPAEFKVLGEYSALCEQLGADFLILSKRGLIGCQRKEQTDLVASMRSSDRIAREISLLKSESLEQAVLLIEGTREWGERQRWMTDSRGKPRRVDTGFTRAEYRGVIMSVQAQGIWVIETYDKEDTIATLLQLEDHFSRGEHTSLFRRPKPKSTGDLKRDAGIHLLQSIPGWGYTQAKNVYDHFGKVPIATTVTDIELKAIKGLGPVRIRNYMEVFGNGQGT